MKIKTKQFVKGATKTENIFHDHLAQIAFVGRSNVGKSSMINSLLGGKGLARVGKKPGKTTEINYYKVNDKYYFVDLPGYGFAEGGKEKQAEIRGMILEYLTHEDFKPKKVVIIIDAKSGLTDFDRDMIDICMNEEHPVLIVLNKIDKLNQKELSKVKKDIEEELGDMELFPYSSVLGKNKNLLIETLIK